MKEDDLDALLRRAGSTTLVAAEAAMRRSRAGSGELEPDSTKRAALPGASRTRRPRKFGPRALIPAGIALAATIGVAIVWALPGTGPRQIVVDTVAAAEAAGSAHYTGTTTTVGADEQPVTGEISGSVDFSAMTSMTTVSYARTPTLDYEYIVAGGESYVRLRGEPLWHRTPNSEMLTPADFADPRGFLQRLDSDDISEEGSDIVDGTACTRFATTVTEGDPALVGLSGAKLSLCIDGDDLLREIALVVEHELGRTEARIKFHDYGSDVDIPMPAPDEVAEAPTSR